MTRGNLLILLRWRGSRCWLSLVPGLMVQLGLVAPGSRGWGWSADDWCVARGRGGRGRAAVELWKRRREQSWAVLTRDTLELEKHQRIWARSGSGGREGRRSNAEAGGWMSCRCVRISSSNTWSAHRPKHHTQNPWLSQERATDWSTDSHSVVQKIPEILICHQQTWLNWRNETTASHLCLSTCLSLLYSTCTHPSCLSDMSTGDRLIDVWNWWSDPVRTPTAEYRAQNRLCHCYKRHICAVYSHKSLQVCSLVSSFATVSKSREKSKTDEIFLRVCNDGPQGLLCTISICGLIHIL